jgi:integrase
VHQAVNRAKPAATTKATKTEEERRVIIEPKLRPLLEKMKDEATTDLVFPKLPPYHGSDGQAPTLRADLERAGVKRAALLVPARTRKRMTFHDLRATGITWAAIRGDDTLKIMSRSGHSEYQTMMGYVREGEVMRDGFGDVFAGLPEALLESPRLAPIPQEKGQKPGEMGVPKGIRRQSRTSRKATKRREMSRGLSISPPNS